MVAADINEEVFAHGKAERKQGSSRLALRRANRNAGRESKTGGQSSSPTANIALTTSTAKDYHGFNQSSHAQSHPSQQKPCQPKARSPHHKHILPCCAFRKPQH